MIRNIVRKGRHTELFWRYGFNFFPSVNYKLHSKGHLKGAALDVVNNLNEKGIAITSVEELFGKSDEFAEIDSTVKTIVGDRREELKILKAAARGVKTVGEKTFNVELLGSLLNFEQDDVFARFALQETLLNIANYYFGMLVKLRYYNVWLTFATDAESRESQLWHFDREDNYILKIFLYLDDVDEGTGPFTYAPKTHRKGKLRNINPEHFFEGVVQRSTDEQMAEVVPCEEWIRAVGKKGTIVFADTRGFHKGGEAREKDRLMYTCMFTSAASESKRLLNFPGAVPTEKLTNLQIAALEIK